jgi:hypothetical protein
MAYVRDGHTVCVAHTPRMNLFLVLRLLFLGSSFVAATARIECGENEK